MIILYNLCCLRHNKGDVRNVSIRTLYLNFFTFQGHFKCKFILFIILHNRRKLNHK